MGFFDFFFPLTEATGRATPMAHVNVGTNPQTRGKSRMVSSSTRSTTLGTEVSHHYRRHHPHKPPSILQRCTWATVTGPQHVLT